MRTEMKAFHNKKKRERKNCGKKSKKVTFVEKKITKKGNSRKNADVFEKGLLISWRFIVLQRITRVSYQVCRKICSRHFDVIMSYGNEGAN